MIWLSLSVMLLAAVAFVAWPFYRQQQKLSATAIAAAFSIVAVAAILYWQIGTPASQSATGQAAGQAPSIDEMVQSLAERLQNNPDDLAGWKMLGRSYLELRQFPEAISAFEKAIELESGSNGQTLADLGEVMLLVDQSSISGRAGQLFESALAITPDNPKALFYAGMAALDRGDNELAATRWEALLATSPPANIQEILRQRIAELRGQAPAGTVPVREEAPAAGISVQVELSAEAVAAVPSNATVFVIVRDPAQPSPPIAAVRRIVSELPAVVEIGDADAMIPGRVPSAFSQLEIVARVSLTGQPIAQSGDWSGDSTIQPQSGAIFPVVIDAQIP